MPFLLISRLSFLFQPSQWTWKAILPRIFQKLRLSLWFRTLKIAFPYAEKQNSIFFPDHLHRECVNRNSTEGDPMNSCHEMEDLPNRGIPQSCENKGAPGWLTGSLSQVQKAILSMRDSPRFLRGRSLLRDHRAVLFPWPKVGQVVSFEKRKRCTSWRPNKGFITRYLSDERAKLKKSFPGASTWSSWSQCPS